jgi:hypothetical protein
MPFLYPEKRNEKKKKKTSFQRDANCQYFEVDSGVFLANTTEPVHFERKKKAKKIQRETTIAKNPKDKNKTGSVKKSLKNTFMSCSPRY